MWNSEDLTLGHLKKDAATYSWGFFRKDLWAGLAVALLSIPQALAYSVVVGLPPSCALLSTIFGTGIASLMGASRYLVIGPNNTSVLLVQSATAAILYQYFPNLQPEARTEVALKLMTSMLLCIGIFQLLAASFKLGKVIQFVSFPVVIGYILGASFALTCGQLYSFLGIEVSGYESSLFEKLRYLFWHLGDAHPPTATVGVISLLIFITLRKMSLRATASLIMVVLVTALVYSLELEKIQIPGDGGTLQTIGDIGRVEAVIPSLQVPIFSLRIFNILLPFSFAIALIGMLETTSLARTFGATSGGRLYANQEILGLGASNFVLSFFGALPCSGSILRTTANYESGAKTRFAALFSACFVAIFVALFGELIQYVPIAALSALIIATAMRAVDTKQLKMCLKATHSDAFVLIMTFLACIFFNIQVAFYIGVVASIVLYLRKAASPRVTEYFFDEETEEYRPAFEQEANLARRIRLINIEGELFFGAVDLFQTTFKAIAEDDAASRVFVVRLKHVRDFDATAAMALKQLYDFLKKSGRHLIVASIPPQVWEVIEKAGLVSYIGKDNLFLLDPKNPNESLIVALKRAKAIV